MEKDLNEVDNIALINIAKKLKIVNIDLDQIILNFEGKKLRHARFHIGDGRALSQR